MLAIWEYFWPEQDWEGPKPTPQPYLTFRVEEVGPGMYIVDKKPQ
jgi:hypothetical protein